MPKSPKWFPSAAKLRYAFVDPMSPTCFAYLILFINKPGDTGESKYEALIIKFSPQP